MLYIDILFSLDLNVIGLNCTTTAPLLLPGSIFEAIRSAYEAGKELILILLGFYSSRTKIVLLQSTFCKSKIVTVLDITLEISLSFCHKINIFEKYITLFK